MSVSKLSLLSALTEKMQWHQARQGVLAENVANADTPGFAGRDLKAFEFGDHLADELGMGLSTATTNVKHFDTVTRASSFGTRTETGFEITPDRNGVNLEGQMIKVSENQMDFQAVTALYTRSVRILKVAMGR